MIGIDIVVINRIQNVFARFGERFLRYFLNPQEIQILESKNYKIQSIAGFWAAKEACAKALGVGIGEELKFLDIYVSYSEKNAPMLTLSQAKLKRYNIKQLALSISHDGGFAIAAVIIVR